MLSLFGDFCNAGRDVCTPVQPAFGPTKSTSTAFGDDGTAQAYAEAVLALPAMDEWTEGAQAEMTERAGA